MPLEIEEILVDTPAPAGNVNKPALREYMAARESPSRSIFEFFTTAQKSDVRNGLGLVDVDEAINDAIAEVGDTSILRGVSLVFPSGVYSLAGPLDSTMKALQIRGQGYGRDQSTGGSIFKWNGDVDLPMLRIRNSVMAQVSGFRFMGKDAARPLCAIEFNNNGGSPINTRANFHDLWIGQWTGADPGGEAGGLKNGIITSGTDAQNDQSSIRNVYIQGITNPSGISRGLWFAGTQAVMWSLDTVMINGDSTTRAVETSARHILASNLCLQSNGIDIYIDDDAGIHINQMFSEGGGQLVVAPNGASNFTWRGGYWQAGANIEAGGLVADIVASSSATVLLENCGITRESGYAGPTESWKMRGEKCYVKAQNFGMFPTWDSFFDLATVNSGDWRRIEYSGDDGSGSQKTVSFNRVWTHGMNPVTWTPVGLSGGVLPTPSNAVHKREKDVVYATYKLVYPVTANGADAQVGGLPWTSTDDADDVQGGYITRHDVGANIYTTITRNSKTFEFYKDDGTKYTNAELSGKTIVGMLIYRTSEA